MPREVCEACTFSQLRGETLRLGLRLRDLRLRVLRLVARLLRPRPAPAVASFSRADSRIFCRSVSPALMRAVATCSCARCSAMRAICVAR